MWIAGLAETCGGVNVWTCGSVEGIKRAAPGTTPVRPYPFPHIPFPNVSVRNGGYFGPPWVSMPSPSTGPAVRRGPPWVS